MEWRFPDTGLATCKCDNQPQLDRIKAAEVSKTVRSKNKCFHHLTSVLGIHSNTYPTQHLFFLHRSRYDKSCHLIWVLPVKSARDVKNREIPRWKLTQLIYMWTVYFLSWPFIVLSSLWFQEKKMKVRAYLQRTLQFWRRAERHWYHLWKGMQNSPWMLRHH